MVWQYVSNSIIGISIAEICTLPIYTLKTNYQNSNSKESMISLTKQIYHRGGVFEFYRASPFAIGSQALATGIKYPIYKCLDNQNFEYSNKFLNGIASGIIGSLIIHPVDAVKIYWQMGTPFLPELRKTGIKLFYRGYSKTLSKNIAGGATYMPIFEYTNNYLQNSFVSSFVSAVLSTIIVHPFDYLKTRHIYGQSLFQGWHPLIYYKGFWLSLTRIVPHFIIFASVLDYLNAKK